MSQLQRPYKLLLVKVHYSSIPNCVDAYVDGSKVPAVISHAITNTQQHGTSLHNINSTTLTVLFEGPKPVDLLIAVCVMRDGGLSVSTSAFCSSSHASSVANIALLLSIRTSHIKVLRSSSKLFMVIARE